ncbi:DUF3043 domain-containing protein [Cellulomonas sp. CW35]|uniref:DUF3043 domain-containing protein n=1 Tax=Cellulomonas sp. CW35 TaxID=3458249 RepID=UPI004034D6D0
MFGRQKPPVTPPTEPGDDLPVGIIEGKGRPTPRRKEAEAANRRPLVPSDRQSAAKAARVAQRTQREREYEAQKRGDESAMPARDRGPVRRFVRDWVDARLNLVEVFLPIVLVCFVVQMTFMQINAWASLIALAVLYAFTVAAIIDAIVLWFRLKRRVIAKFGEVQQGALFYGLVRAFQVRRSRLPKPQVKRRAYPE